MKRKVDIALALLIPTILLYLSLWPTCSIFAATEIGGTINTDTTWTVADSPYIVASHVVVSQGVALSIEPGVEVRFNKGKLLQINGTLIARGNSNNYITFTSNQTDPQPGDWAYIYFTDTSTDATFDSNDNYIAGCIMEYCIVEYSGSTGQKGAIWTESASPFINYSTIRNNSNNGIYLRYTGLGTTWLSNNTITNNTETGIYADSSSTLNITDNRITNNIARDEVNGSGGGIYLRSSGTTNITRNTITDNTTSVYSGSGGILVYSSGSVNINKNLITRNTAGDHDSLGSLGGGGIFIYSSSNVYITNNTITSNHTRMSARHNGGINVQGAAQNIDISNNAISHTKSGNGISTGGTESLYITNNAISQNSYHGIYTQGAKSIANNTITQNGMNGIEASLSGISSITYNTITANGGAGTVVSGYPDLNYNDIYNNQGYELANTNPYSSSAPHLDATNNWWGTTDETIIQEEILDWNDDPEKGIADYKPYLSSPQGNLPPNIPSNPSPANNATGVSITPTLSWSGGDPDSGDTVTYEVYLDTSGATTKVASNQTATSYNPGTLNYSTTYYWKVIARDNHGAEAGGPVWSFTTLAAPSSNNPPIARAGSDQVVATGSQVKLDGSGSTDPDGDSITYSWTLLSKPEGSGMAITDSTAQAINFTADKDGLYKLQLIVSDGKAQSSPDYVTVRALGDQDKIVVATNQTQYKPGDTLELYVWVGNSSTAQELKADAYIGFGFPDGSLYFFDPALNLKPSDPTDPRTFTPFAQNVTLPSGWVFPISQEMNVDIDSNGKPDSYLLFSVTLPSTLPPGTYFAFAALAAPGSAHSGSPQLIGNMSLTYFIFNP